MQQLGWPKPRDSGAAVLFFLSPAAAKITNQSLTDDATGR